MKSKYPWGLKRNENGGLYCAPGQIGALSRVKQWQTRQVTIHDSAICKWASARLNPKEPRWLVYSDGQYQFTLAGLAAELEVAA